MDDAPENHKVKAHEILINDYDERRAATVVDFNRTVEQFGGIIPYAAYWLSAMTGYENDPSRQWGSAHHITAILAERLGAEIEGYLGGMADAAKIAESQFDERTRMEKHFEWTDGYAAGTQDAAAAIRQAAKDKSPQ